MPFTKGMFKKLKCLKKHVTFKGRREKNNSELEIEELQQSLCVLDEENLLIKNQLKQKHLEIQQLRQANLRLTEKYETKEALFQEDKRFLCNEISLLRSDINEKQMELEQLRKDNVLLKKDCKTVEELLKDEQELNQVLQSDKHRREQEIPILNYNLKDIQISKGNNNGGFINALTEEVKSYIAVLELKQNEINKLQLALVEANQKEEEFQVVLRNVCLLKTKCEDLEEQLKRKAESKKALEEEIYKLRKIILEQNAEMKGLSSKNEELLFNIESKGKTVLKTIKFDSQIPATQMRKYIRKGVSVGYFLDLDDRPTKVQKL